MIMRALRNASALIAVVALAFAAPQAAAQAAAKPAAAPAANPLAKWQAGRHYRVISPAVPTSVAPGKVEVVEVIQLHAQHLLLKVLKCTHKHPSSPTLGVV